MGHSNPVRMSRVGLLVYFFLAAAAGAKQIVEKRAKLFFDTNCSTLSTTSDCKQSQSKEDIQSSKEDWSLGREGRFLHYWAPSTVFSISTSSTTTVTLDHWHHLRIVSEVDPVFI